MPNDSFHSDRLGRNVHIPQCTGNWKNLTWEGEGLNPKEGQRPEHAFIKDNAIRPETDGTQDGSAMRQSEADP